MEEKSQQVPELFSNITLKAKKPLDSKYPINPITIGDHLLKKRLDNKKAQREFAVFLSVSTNTISNWENNKPQPNINKLAKIIELLGYDPLKPKENKLSSIIKAYRREKGLSQKKLAKLTGLDEETIIRLEKGGKVWLRTQKIIAKLLND